MSAYVDGFVIPLPKDKIEAYRGIAEIAAKVWMEHGALSYRECVGDDLEAHCGISFPALAKLSPEETVIFAWIVYPSKEDRDRVNAAVMEDPRLKELMDKMPFDGDRMTSGGFRTLVEA